MIEKGGVGGEKRRERGNNPIVTTGASAYPFFPCTNTYTIRIRIK